MGRFPFAWFLLQNWLLLLQDLTALLLDLRAFSTWNSSRWHFSMVKWCCLYPNLENSWFCRAWDSQPCLESSVFRDWGDGSVGKNTFYTSGRIWVQVSNAFEKGWALLHLSVTAITIWVMETEIAKACWLPALALGSVSNLLSRQSDTEEQPMSSGHCISTGMGPCTHTHAVHHTHMYTLTHTHITQKRTVI